MEEEEVIDISTCPILAEEFDDDPTIIDKSSSHLPVQSARCAHRICYSCVLALKMDKACEQNKDPNVIKWLVCPFCRLTTCFNSEEPVVDLGRCEALKALHAKDAEIATLKEENDNAKKRELILGRSPSKRARVSRILNAHRRSRPSPRDEFTKSRERWYKLLPAGKFYERLCLVKTSTDCDTSPVPSGSEMEAYKLWPALKFNSHKDLISHIKMAEGLESAIEVLARITLEYFKLPRNASKSSKVKSYGVAYLLGKGSVEHSLALLPQSIEGQSIGHTFDFFDHIDEMLMREGHCATPEFQEAFEMAMERMEAAMKEKAVLARVKKEKTAAMTTVSSARKTFTHVEYSEYASPEKIETALRLQSDAVASKKRSADMPLQGETGGEAKRPKHRHHHHHHHRHHRDKQSHHHEKHLKQHLPTMGHGLLKQSQPIQATICCEGSSRSL